MPGSNSFSSPGDFSSKKLRGEEVWGATPITSWRVWTGALCSFHVEKKKKKPPSEQTSLLLILNISLTYLDLCFTRIHQPGKVKVKQSTLPKLRSWDYGPGHSGAWRHSGPDTVWRYPGCVCPETDRCWATHHSWPTPTANLHKTLWDLFSNLCFPLGNLVMQLPDMNFVGDTVCHSIKRLDTPGRL